VPPLFLLLGCSLLCAPPARPDRKPARARWSSHTSAAGRSCDPAELPHSRGRPELQAHVANLPPARPVGTAPQRSGAPSRPHSRSELHPYAAELPPARPAGSIGGGAPLSCSRAGRRRKIQAQRRSRAEGEEQAQDSRPFSRSSAAGGPPSEVGRLRPDLHRYWRYGLGKRKKGGGREEREKVPPPSSSSNRNRQVVEPNRSRRPAAPPPFYSLFTAPAMPDCL
jgi:hypothetical protein